MSYDPRVKQRPIFVKRVHRDEKYINELEINITTFVNEMKELLSKLTAEPEF